VIEGFEAGEYVVVEAVVVIWVVTAETVCLLFFAEAVEVVI
jgi:hypothetical protein